MTWEGREAVTWEGREAMLCAARVPTRGSRRMESGLNSTPQSVETHTLTQCISGTFQATAGFQDSDF